MDLYRYFHPHHNPRLGNTPIRLQELSELEQAAVELKKAVQRAEIRTENASVAEIKPEHFAEIASALDYIIEALNTMIDAHPGDEVETMAQLLSERQNAPGWENWTRLLHQRLQLANPFEDR